MKRRRKRRKRRQLWDGRYKPFYEITHMDEYLVEKSPIDCDTFQRNWWSFLDEMDMILRSGLEVRPVGSQFDSSHVGE